MFFGGVLEFGNSNCFGFLQWELVVDAVKIKKKVEIIINNNAMVVFFPLKTEVVESKHIYG